MVALIVNNLFVFLIVIFLWLFRKHFPSSSTALETTEKYIFLFLFHPTFVYLCAENIVERNKNAIFSYIFFYVLFHFKLYL